MRLTEAIILAGGLGTRLQGVVSDMPKPMALVAGKPFLEYLLNYLDKYGITRVVLSVGYKHEAIREYFGTLYAGCELVYAVEKEPLGTGGGVKNAMQFIKGDTCYLLNGDTIFNVDLYELYSFYLKNQFDLLLSLKEMTRFDRYGTVETEGNHIVQFFEKRYKESGLINGGIYVVDKQKFESIDFPPRFSFEKDYMEAFVSRNRFGGQVFDNYFIDIGIPEDYSIAQKELKDFSF